MIWWSFDQAALSTYTWYLWHFVVVSCICVWLQDMALVLNVSLCSTCKPHLSLSTSNPNKASSTFPLPLPLLVRILYLYPSLKQFPLFVPSASFHSSSQGLNIKKSLQPSQKLTFSLGESVSGATLVALLSASFIFVDPALAFKVINK